MRYVVFLLKILAVLRDKCLLVDGLGWVMKNGPFACLGGQICSTATVWETPAIGFA